MADMSGEDGYLGRHYEPTAVAKRDALNRSWRTLGQGLLIDLVVAALIVLVPLMTEVEWTRLYWLSLLGMVGKSLVQAVVSYLARLFLPPVQ